VFKLMCSLGKSTRPAAAAVIADHAGSPFEIALQMSAAQQVGANHRPGQTKPRARIVLQQAQAFFTTMTFRWYWGLCSAVASSQHLSFQA
jgi:hypothetical protein